LLFEGHMTLEFTKLLVLDWNWRDIKLKRMVDQREIREPLAEIFFKYLIPTMKKHGKPKIGLF